MELISKLSGFRNRLPGAVLSIGNFAGLHRGHTRIITEVVRRAGRARVPAAVFTFASHSLAVLSPAAAPRLLMRPEEKLRIFEQMGIDAVFMPRRARPVLGLPPDIFAEKILARAIGVGCIVEGRGFRFGKGRTGTLVMLRRLGQGLGFDVRTVEPVKVGGRIVSSTWVRRLLGRGRVVEAARCLGRPFLLDGTVTKWERRGSILGFPTVNLKSPELIVPAEGVYAGETLVGKKWYAAAICVGGAPTFGRPDADMVEAYLLDFNRDVYGQKVRVKFLRRLRGQKTFHDAEALRTQMKQDCRDVRRILGAK